MNIIDLIKKEKVEYVKLKDIANLQKGKIITNKQIITGDIPVVSGGMKPSYYHNQANIFEPVITVAASGSAGFLDYFEQPIWLSDAIGITKKDNILIKFLYYYLKHQQDIIYGLKKGKVVSHIYISDLGNIFIPVPSLEIQEKIVKTLDKFTKYVSELHRELHRELQYRNNQYTYYRDYLLNDKNLLKMSEGSKTDKFFLEHRTLQDIVYVDAAGVDKKINDNEQMVSLLNYMDVYTNNYIHKRLLNMTVSAPENKLTKCNILRGDIFVTPTSETTEDIFRTAVAIEDIDNAVYSYHLVRLRLKNVNYTTSCYLNYYFKSNLFKSQINKYVYGQTRKMIPKTSISKMLVSIPPLLIQQQVVSILDKFSELVTQTTGLLPEEIEKRQKQYEYYREKLLTFDLESGSKQASKQASKHK
ncbi:restriction endonuclease subunit S [Ureaplasma sp. ES3154-GEN]|uniref:restriction endonuclease subunit S n=1 Tax=Ureaplasma sp. ES3154-GEN TaxID=2984844 RepID=UPI0021E6D766|nr:restriction endonuclease subunit S [Ureaplasma sp. ES3154-GEN]MCV3743554.1 restriction endonuclease subunit S [Ureaplasma sp. ES3154-GEN]